MRRFLIVPMLALSLIGAGSFVTGCAPLQSAVSFVTESKVDPNTVYIARNAFNIAQVTATRYLRLRRCSATSGPVCRSPVATAHIIPAVRSGIVARNELRDFARAHHDELGPRGAYNALVAATNTLKTIFATYNVEGTVK